MSLAEHPPILGFFGEYEFLSNFYESPGCTIDGIPVPTNEHKFQASKALTAAHRDYVLFHDLKIEDERAFTNLYDRTRFTTPAQSKKRGRSIPRHDDWDTLRLAVMWWGLQEKFQNPEMRAKLLATGDAYLEETNTWGDRFWGVDGTGKNMLGIMLMRLRDQLSPENPVFVFGSNLAGRHGAGAAKFAAEHRGAIRGQGEGYQGNSYGIPTKDFNIQVRSLKDINDSVDRFIKFATENDDLKFQLTPIGCGLAGYKYEQIAPMFRNAPDNVELPEEFKACLDS